LNNPSKAYEAALEASKEIHKGKAFTGKFLRPHAVFIKEIIDRLGVNSILDFGCGKGQQYEWVIPSTGQTIEQFWGVEVTKYDPAYPPFAKEPEGTFDLVICTQVLGVIPIADLKWVIDRLFGYAGKAIYVSERLGDARKKVGDNSLRPTDWDVATWCGALARQVPIEVTFASREIIEGEKITKHHRTDGSCLWKEVEWPEGIKAMNHKWEPDGKDRA
jgi:SAM-dependent methyltransferase